MRRLVPLLLVSCLLNFGFISVSHAATAHAPSGKLVHVIVQLAGSPVAADSNLKQRNRATRGHFRLDLSLSSARFYETALQRYQRQEVAYLRANGVHLTVGRQFSIVFNGFSATVPQNQLARLSRMAHVTRVYAEHHYYPMLNHSLQLVNVPQAWNQLGGQAEAGKGIRIADLDTGIDIHNPCFRDTGMAPPGNGFPRADNAADKALTNNKVIVVRAFGGNSSHTYSAQDMVGHGTFTSAIEACDAGTKTSLGTTLSGVAPAAYLMEYDIFADQQTGATDSSILAALDAALLDGADVINMSIGGAAGDPKMDAETSAVENAIKAGVSVSISAGNEGPAPQSLASPADAPDAIAVGATSNSSAVTASVSVNGPGTVPDNLSRIRAVEGSNPWSNKVGPANLVYVGLGRLPNDDPDNKTANDFAGKDLKGKIALIQRGTLLFNTKLNNAQKEGAIGAIVFDNHYEVSPVTMALTNAKLPAFFINQAAGQALLQWITDHPDATATMDPTLTQVNQPANVLEDFSSRGFGPNYSIKPDIVAPGGDIYAATESNAVNNDMYNPTGFMDASGTSFSAPHVTGIIALLLQKHPTWTPREIKAVLMSTASTAVTEQGVTPNVMDVGAGLVNASAALSAPAYLAPASVSFGGINVGYGAVSKTDDLSLNDISGGAGTWSVAVNSVQGSGVSVTAPTSVTLGAGGHATVPVHLSASATVNPGSYDGYITLTRGSDSIHAPYYVHVATTAVRQASVLLVDDSTNQMVITDPTKSLIKHVDYTHYYTDALHAVGKPYTYWNVAQQGDPGLADLKRAQAVIYFTGNNLGGFDPANTDPTALFAPLLPTGEIALRQYVDGGGHLFVTGRGAVLAGTITDWPWIVLGGGPANLSLYDTPANDKKNKGGIQPPQPSMVPDSRPKIVENPWLFSGLKGIDISNKGDGAGNNGGIYSDTLNQAGLPPVIGVPGLSPVQGNNGTEGTAYGVAALRSTRPNLVASSSNGAEAGLLSSDEPSFKHRATYRGRAITFSFGFESINSNTGYATRTQVLSRIFAWFNDHPKAAVTTSLAQAHRSWPLKLRLTGLARQAQVVWQVGGKRLRAVKGTAHYTFPHPGTYNLRAEVTDRLGHVAVTAWHRVKAR